MSPTMFTRRCPRIVALRLVLASACLVLLSAVNSTAQTQVRQVKILGGKNAVEIEVEASDRINPQTQVLSGPDRLVIDFPNAVPGGQLRSQSVEVGEVKDLRIGLFQSRPPVTRIVLDLRTAQSFQVFPYGRTVMIKVMGSGAAIEAVEANSRSAGQSRPGLVAANYSVAREPVRLEPAKPKLEVSFRDGLLTINANKATLSEVLFGIQQRTGAQISIPPGADQEKVVADLGPAPAQEVLAHLLNGSRFNFLILNAASDPQKLDRVILSPRGEGANMALPPVQTADDSSAEDESPIGPSNPQPVPVGIPATQPPPPGGQPYAPPPVPEEQSPEQ